MKAPIINLVDAPTRRATHDEHFSHSLAALAGLAGGKSIGADVTRVPPGKDGAKVASIVANDE